MWTAKAQARLEHPAGMVGAPTSPKEENRGQAPLPRPGSRLRGRRREGRAAMRPQAEGHLLPWGPARLPAPQPRGARG